MNASYASVCASVCASIGMLWFQCERILSLFFDVLQFLANKTVECCSNGFGIVHWRLHVAHLLLIFLDHFIRMKFIRLNVERWRIIIYNHNIEKTMTICICKLNSYGNLAKNWMAIYWMLMVIRCSTHNSKRVKLQCVKIHWILWIIQKLLDSKSLQKF